MPYEMKHECTIRWHYHFELGENLTCVISTGYGNPLSKTLLLPLEEKSAYWFGSGAGKVNSILFRAEKSKSSLWGVAEGKPKEEKSHSSFTLSWCPAFHPAAPLPRLR